MSASPGYRAGDRVGLVPNAGCGQCSACIRGKTNYCPDLHGVRHRPGWRACGLRADPEPLHHAGQHHALPAGVSDHEASLLEPFSCVVNGVRSARIELGDTVVIYGAGPDRADARDALPRGRRGQVDRHRCACGATRTRAQPGVRPDARSGARRHPGARAAETGGSGADVVITACPAAEVQSEAVQLLAPFGRLCLFGGLPKTSGPVPLNTNAIHYGNFLVTGSTGGAVEDYRIALRLVAGKRIDLTRVISHVFSVDGPARRLRRGAGRGGWQSRTRGGLIMQPPNCWASTLARKAPRRCSSTAAVGRWPRPSVGLVCIGRHRASWKKTPRTSSRACAGASSRASQQWHGPGDAGRDRDRRADGWHPGDRRRRPPRYALRFVARHALCATTSRRCSSGPVRRSSARRAGRRASTTGRRSCGGSRSEGRRFDRIAAFVQPGSYAAMRLCGMDASQAFIDKSYLHFSGFADNVARTVGRAALPDVRRADGQAAAHRRLARGDRPRGGQRGDVAAD